MYYSEDIEKDNEKYLAIFKNDLLDEGLSNKSINRYVAAASYYLDNLNDLYGKSMQDGCISNFIEDFFGYHSIY